VSGPVTDEDAPPDAAAPEPAPPRVEVIESHVAQVGHLSVRRALPRRARRTVGAWCFADHMGPVSVGRDEGIDIGPHPHTGLQTVTWLVAGEVLHRDSLGSEQVIRPGQLNLMTAGRGVAHSEEHTGRYAGSLHGIQLWVAQPDRTRGGEAAFEHHGALPALELDHGVATVVVGELGGLVSPARRDTDHVGAELALRTGTTTVPLGAGHEHALVVLEGAVRVEGHVVEPGALAYLGDGRDELAVAAREPARAFLLGGVPFPEPVLMWWNFVARTRDEISAAWESWSSDDGRFGAVSSPLARILTPPPNWRQVSRPGGGS
jgi:hypothetical protein